MIWQFGLCGVWLLGDWADVSVCPCWWESKEKMFIFHADDKTWRRNPQFVIRGEETRGWGWVVGWGAHLRGALGWQPCLPSPMTYCVQNESHRAERETDLQPMWTETEDVYYGGPEGSTRCKDTVMLESEKTPSSLWQQRKNSQKHSVSGVMDPNNC